MQKRVWSLGKCGLDSLTLCSSLDDHCRHSPANAHFDCVGLNESAVTCSLDTPITFTSNLTSKQLELSYFAHFLRRRRILTLTSTGAGPRRSGGASERVKVVCAMSSRPRQSAAALTVGSRDDTDKSGTTGICGHRETRPWSAPATGSLQEKLR
jgi:hypothetical protein